MNPEVTIAIPTYNRVGLLKRALESALIQRESNIEIIISDDGSSDGTQEMLDTLNDDRVRTFARQENAGIYVNMNTCLNNARGEYFLLLSDDDYLLPGCIENLLKPWRHQQDIIFSYGQWWYEREGRRTLQQSLGPYKESGFEYVYGCWKGERPTILHGTLFKTESIRNIGGIPDGFAQDTFLKQRLAFEGYIAYVPEPVTSYCFHAGSTTNSINLFTLIKERDAVLQMCLRVAREKQLPNSYLKELSELGRQQFNKDASHGIVSAFASGRQRKEVLREAVKLRKYLESGIIRGFAAMLMVALFPRVLVYRLKKIFGDGASS